MQTLQETIRPSAELRNHYSEIYKLCRAKKEADVISGRVSPLCDTFEDLRNILKGSE